MVERAQPPAGPVRRTGRWWRAGRNAGRSFAALTSAAVLGTMGYGWWAAGNVDDDTVTTDVIAHDVQDQRVPLDGAVDMLLVGVDSRTDARGNPLPQEVMDLLHAGVNDGELNTDTMILVHIPVDGTRAVAISFPRDSWVDIAGGYGEHRLNSAFAYAYNDARDRLANQVPNERQLEDQAKVAGRKNLIATVQNLIGHAVTIDRYAEVNLASFYEVTKAIGGVDVCLKKATHDPYSGASFRKGKQTISGAKALAFVRQRHGLEHGDLDRIVRQQAFLGALANKVLSADMLTSPSKVRELIEAVQRSVVLSKGWQLSTFAAQMAGLTGSGIDFYTIPVVGDANIGGADVLQVDPDSVASFVRSLTSDEKPKKKKHPGSNASPSAGSRAGSKARPTEDGRPSLGMFTVDVRNGSTTQGLATNVRDSLAQQGFNPGDVGDTEVRDSSVIRYAPGEENVAQYASDQLGGGFRLTEDPSQPQGRLWIVVGTDFHGVPDAVASGRLLAQPSSSPAQPPPSDAPPPSLNAGGLNCVY